MTPETPIARLRNLGPKMAQWLDGIGIHTRADLSRAGAVDAWIRLKAVGQGRVSLLALYAMQAALMDVDWRELPDELKAALREAVEDPA
ncbi:TfoX/Sxy family protein [Maricaulis sp.]|uniref:TfoX/Sxy family protein n=1 Tax=Maricaulis sp. TaxID=1486257 RepID=UPI003A92760E